MARSYKLNPETMEEDFKINHVGNSRHKLAHDKEVVRRSRKRSQRQAEEKELIREVYARDS